MPWHNRGSMTEKESWSVTAYILKLNGIDPGSELNAETAAKIDLSVIDPSLYPTSALPSPEAQPLSVPENTPAPAPTLVHEEQTIEPFNPVWIFALVIAIMIVLAVIFVRRRSTK
jgi:hypothetical protein